jgi:hypothetical protein
MPWRWLVTTALCASLIVALALLWQRRSSVLDLWLLVLLAGWLIDVMTRAAAPDDASVPWHIARLCGVLGVAVILGVRRAELPAGFARREHPPARRAATPDAQVVLDEVAEQLVQPLCAITANADAIGRLLDHERPDFDEVRAALADIVDEAARASVALRAAQRATAGGRRSPD